MEISTIKKHLMFINQKKRVSTDRYLHQRPELQRSRMPELETTVKMDPKMASRVAPQVILVKEKVMAAKSQLVIRVMSRQQAVKMTNQEIKAVKKMAPAQELIHHQVVRMGNSPKIQMEVTRHRVKQEIATLEILRMVRT